MEPLTLALGHRVLAVLIPGRLFWPYFAGALILILGLSRINITEVLRAGGIERSIVFGPLFFAIPRGASSWLLRLSSEGHRTVLGTEAAERVVVTVSVRYRVDA